MTNKQYNKLKKWFLGYTSNYLDYPGINKENILLKKKHTLRVCSNMEKIYIDLPKQDRITSLAVALLHDIGRFEQLRKYGTFSDQKSEDHATLGVKIIKEIGILKDLDPKEEKLILIAIENHNKVDISSELTKKEEEISKLIRDADKLDIWHIVVEYYKEGREKLNPAIVHNLPLGDDVTPQIYNLIEKKLTIPYSLLKTVVDMKVFQMGWVYDINTKAALKIIDEESYLEDIFETLPKTDKISNIYNIIQNYLKSVLSENLL